MGAAPVELRLQPRRAQQGRLQEEVVPARAQPQGSRKTVRLCKKPPCSHVRTLRRAACPGEPTANVPSLTRHPELHLAERSCPAAMAAQRQD